MSQPSVRGSGRFTSFGDMATTRRVMRHTDREARRANGTSVSYTDHWLVNAFLMRVNVYPEIVGRFDPTFYEQQGLYSLADVGTLILEWRQRAWDNFVRLRDAATPEARGQIAADIEAYTTSTAEAIRDGYALEPGETSSVRNAWCANE